jgi:methylmalonyl-CoA mutase N-terminal domain/subunit
MYTGRLWTMRQYAGFGTAEETNERFRRLLAPGRADSPPRSICPPRWATTRTTDGHGEVGRVGVAIDTVDDLADLFRGIPLDRVSTSMTINATAAILLAMYVVVARSRASPVRP